MDTFNKSKIEFGDESTFQNCHRPTVAGFTHMVLLRRRDDTNTTQKYGFRKDLKCQIWY